MWKLRRSFELFVNAATKMLKIWAIRLLLLIYFIHFAVALPTLGHIDRDRLETYEVLSEESNDLNVFNNLTFNFSCESKTVGLYADIDYHCRIFHACDVEGKGFPVLCPNSTIFDQKEHICSDDESVDCDNAQEWYYLNDLPDSNETTEKGTDNDWQNDDSPSVLPLSWM